MLSHTLGLIISDASHNNYIVVMDRLARRREILNDKSAMFSMLPNELLCLRL